MTYCTAHPVSSAASSSSRWTSRSFVVSFAESSTTSTKSAVIASEIPATSTKSAPAKSPAASSSAPSHHLITWRSVTVKPATTTGKSTHRTSPHRTWSSHHSSWASEWRATPEQWWVCYSRRACCHCHPRYLVCNGLCTCHRIEVWINSNAHQRRDSCSFTCATTSSSSPAIPAAHEISLGKISVKH